MRQTNQQQSGPTGHSQADNSPSPEAKGAKALTKETSGAGVPERKLDDTHEALASFLGTKSMEVAVHLLRQVYGVFPGTDPKGHEPTRVGFRVLGGVAPKDQIEGLLAVQMLGTHNLAMEFMKRAAYRDQTVAGVDMNVNRATKVLRMFVAQVEALNRYRGRGQQKVTVEHVHVNRGGQAIVGAVSHNKQGGGGYDGEG